MQIAKALVFRRQVLRWLVLLISLWIAIILALAISGSAVAKAVPQSGPIPSHIDQFDQNLHLAVYRPAGQTLANSRTNDLPHPFAERQLPAPETLFADALPEQWVEIIPPRSEVAQPRPVPNLSITCQTPMSLMLHSSFGEERMRELARAILVRGLKTMTYAEATQVLRSGECPASNSIIVSLDDFGTDWLRSYFKPMIRAFSDRGLKLVVAVNVHGDQDPDAWSYLRDFLASGNEVANHTLDHYNLARLEPAEINRQIKVAHQVICANLGTCPETLILPFGNIDNQGSVMSAARGYTYVVGIPGGREFSGEPPYYLGRIGPRNSDQRGTLNELAVTFAQLDSPLDSYLALRRSAGRGCSIGPTPSASMPAALCVPAIQSSIYAGDRLQTAEQPIKTE